MYMLHAHHLIIMLDSLVPQLLLTIVYRVLHHYHFNHLLTFLVQIAIIVFVILHYNHLQVQVVIHLLVLLVVDRILIRLILA